MDQHMANIYKYSVCLKRICVRGLGIQCSIDFFYQNKLQFVSVPQVLYLLHSLWRLFLMCFHCQLGAFQVTWVVKNMPANAGDTRDTGSIAGSVRSPGGEHGNPLQRSCMENPMERGAWRATVHRVAESETIECVHTMLETILTNFRPILTDSRLRLPPDPIPKDASFLTFLPWAIFLKALISAWHDTMYLFVFLLSP